MPPYRLIAVLQITSQRGFSEAHPLLALLLALQDDPFTHYGPCRRTRLHYCVRQGNGARVSLLLRRGADLEGSDAEGQRPLFYAAQFNKPALVSLLLDAGASHAPASDGTTPLSVACQIGYLPIVQQLLVRGADVDLKDEDGYSPLFVAAQEGHVEIIRALIDSGAQLETRNNVGLTPLFIAAQQNRIGAVRELLARGANVDARSNSGATALLVACEENHVEMVRVLLRAGAAQIAANDEATPMIAASVRNFKAVVALLKEAMLSQNRQPPSSLAPSEK